MEQKDDLYLTFDTETTGLPDTPCFGQYYHPQQRLDAYDSARVVQLAWQLRNSRTHELLREQSFKIQPSHEDAWNMHPKAEAVHGMSRRTLTVQGSPMKMVLKQFMIDLNKASTLVAHNLYFDLNVLGAEMVREESDSSMWLLRHMCGMTRVCTMKSTTEFCGLTTSWGKKKPPKLVELYAILFENEQFPDAHDALGDVRATSRVAQELQSRNLICL